MPNVATLTVLTCSAILETDPTFGPALRGRGEAKHAMGEFETAAKCYKAFLDGQVCVAVAVRWLHGSDWATSVAL
jgi:hypothetical protein